MCPHAHDRPIWQLARSFCARHILQGIDLTHLLVCCCPCLQLEPKDLSEQLKRTGAAIPGIRPGKQTAEYVASTLTRMSLLGSIFLGALSLAPAAVEGLTHLSAFRGFAGTSVLIMVGVATDTARRIRAEQAMAKYQDVDKLYDDLKS